MSDRVRKIIALWAVMMGLLVAPSRAAVVERLEACRQRSWLLLNLDARDLLDAKTTSTVESGLPGTCVYEVILANEKGKHLVRRFLQWTLRFDLWKNEYIVQTLEGDRTFSTLAEADSAWSQIRAVRLFPLEEMPKDQRYRLLVRVSVQPLGAEEKARISRYVSQNSRRDRDEFSVDVGALFKRLVGKGDASNERVHFEGAWFRIEDLEEKP